MASIKKRIKALLDQRVDNGPAALIIGTQDGYMTFVFGLESWKKSREFTTVQEARDALAACGVKKIGEIACD